MMLTDLVMQFQSGDFKKEWSDEELKMAEKVILRKYPWLKEQFDFTSSSSVSGCLLCGKEYISEDGYFFQGILLDHNSNTWELWGKDNDLRVTPLEKQIQADYYVSMTDTVLSGVLFEKEHLIILCDTYEQAEAAAKYVKNDYVQMADVMVGFGFTPVIGEKDRVSFSRYENWNVMEKADDSKKHVSTKSVRKFLDYKSKGAR